MSVLIAVLSTGKGSWKLVSDLISCEDWKNVFLVTNDFGAEKFSHSRPVNFVIVDLNDSVNIMRDKLINVLNVPLRNEIGFGDVALNFSSGSGKEHMALISAVFKIGVGVRIVDFDGVKLVNL